MTRRRSVRLNALLAAALLASGCDRAPTLTEGSITVKLPPAHDAVPMPGFAEDDA